MVSHSTQPRTATSSQCVVDIVKRLVWQGRKQAGSGGGAHARERSRSAFSAQQRTKGQRTKQEQRSHGEIEIGYCCHCHKRRRHGSMNWRRNSGQGPQLHEFGIQFYNDRRDPTRDVCGIATDPGEWCTSYALSRSERLASYLFRREVADPHL